MCVRVCVLKLYICLWACVSFFKGGRKEEVNLVDRVTCVHGLFFLLLFNNDFPKLYLLPV